MADRKLRNLNRFIEALEDLHKALTDCINRTGEALSIRANHD